MSNLFGFKFSNYLTIYKVRIITATFLWVLVTKFSLMSQGHTSAQPSFFDEKYTLKIGSELHADSQLYLVKKDLPIQIKKVAGDTIYVNFLKENSQKTSTIQNIIPIISRPVKHYMLLSDGMDKIKFSDWDISPLLIPLKIRPVTADNPMQFIGDVALGPYFGFQKGVRSLRSISEPSQHSYTLAGFASPTFIRLDNSTTDSSDKDADTILGFSTGISLLLQLNDYQLGLVTGVDWISGASSTSWIYQGKLWYSFSFAYDLANK